MASREAEQALALAGMFQALAQVRDIATHGYGDSRRMEPCVKALLGTYNGDLLELYGGQEAIYPGLRLLVDHLASPNEADLTRYLVAVLHLERKLTGDRERFQRLLSGIQQAAGQAEYFKPLHENVIRNIGDLYQETVSHVRPRILIQGERGYLEDPRNAALIRTLLLSALRAASLWRQCGGTRLRLIFGRKRLIEEARKLLATV